MYDDSVNHNIIIKKLKKLDLQPNTIDWFRSYLASRTQITCVNQIYSDIAPVTCGVPQGFVFGLLLFLVFINFVWKTKGNLEDDLIKFKKKQKKRPRFSSTKIFI